MQKVPDPSELQQNSHLGELQYRTGMLIKGAIKHVDFMNKLLSILHRVYGKVYRISIPFTFQPSFR